MAIFLSSLPTSLIKTIIFVGHSLESISLAAYARKLTLPGLIIYDREAALNPKKNAME